MFLSQGMTYFAFLERSISFCCVVVCFSCQFWATRKKQWSQLSLILGCDKISVNWVFFGDFSVFSKPAWGLLNSKWDSGDKNQKQQGMTWKSNFIKSMPTSCTYQNTKVDVWRGVICWSLSVMRTWCIWVWLNQQSFSILWSFLCVAPWKRIQSSKDTILVSQKLSQAMLPSGTHNAS